MRNYIRSKQIDSIFLVQNENEPEDKWRIKLRLINKGVFPPFNLFLRMPQLDEELQERVRLHLKTIL